MSTWKQLWRLVHIRPRFILLATLLAIIHRCSYQVEAFVGRSFFDELQNPTDIWGHVLPLVGILVVTRIARVVMSYQATMVNIINRFLMGTVIQVNALEYLMSGASGAEHSGEGGEAVSRFRDDVNEVTQFITRLTYVIGVFAFSAIAVYVMVRIDAQITLFVFLPLLVVASMMQVLSKRVRDYRSLNRTAAGKVSQAISEVFGAIQPVKLAGAEQRVVDHLQSLHDHRGRSATKDRVFNSTLEAVWGSFHTVGTGLILLLAANAMRSGSFTLGDFTLFVSYLGIVSELPKLVGSLIASYGQVGVALGRLNELGPNRNLGELFEPTKVYLDEDPPDISRPNVLQGDFGSLQVEGLTYQYPGSGRGVFDATLEVQQGDFVVITGRVGSGKSTLLRALVGLHSATSGSVKIDGQLVEERAKQRQSNVFAFVSQDPRLFSESIRNNILSGFEDDRDELAETVHTAVLEQDLDALEDGIDTMVGRRGVTLSGGQVKRVATARSLFQRPDVLVMDDVSNALDSETETALFSRLADVRTVTVIVSSTRRSALLRANHIVVMKDGFVESQGSLAELLEHSGELREIWTTTIDDADSDSNRSGSAATQMN